MDLALRVAEALAVDAVDELPGGHQSRVFGVELEGLTAVAKVLDASMVDRAELGVRVDITEALAELDPRVCRPLRVGEQRVVELSSAEGEAYYIVCYEYAGGSAPDPALPDDAERMGTTLSELHVTMGQLPTAPLPLVHALRTIPPDAPTAATRHQILHGDFSAGNLRVESGVTRIFDFDDCGYGPPAFDVANTLYMVLFESFVHETSRDYESFRRSFLDGYAGASGPLLTEEAIDRYVDLRVRALRSWLDDLDAAPIGIRTSSASWRSTLRAFASSYRPRASDA